MFGRTERITGNSFLVEVEKRDAATLLPIIQHHIRPGSVIYSDDRVESLLPFRWYGAHAQDRQPQSELCGLYHRCSHPTGGEYVVVMQTHDAGNKNNALFETYLP